MPLADRHGRIAVRLRLSVTDRCNLRCLYCMSESPEWLPAKGILSYEELLRLSRVAVGLGVRKIRLTGGEPLVRRDLPVLVRGLAALPGLESVNLTTNGIGLPAQAAALFEAGLRSLNVSLDTLDDATFRTLTRRDGSPREVLAGLDAAEAAGFRRIKLNTVVVRGLNDAEIPAIARLARDRGWEARFIEFMPLDGDQAWDRSRLVPASEIRAALAAVSPLVDEPGNPSDPAKTFRYADGRGRVGIIASITEAFCGSCDRVRITADGKLRTCLFATAETDLRGPLRNGADDAALAALMTEAVLGKGPGHLVNTAAYVQPARAMHAIGG